MNNFNKVPKINISEEEDESPKQPTEQLHMFSHGFKSEK